MNRPRLARWGLIAAQLALFLAAAFVFVLGTGIGLSRDATVGTAMWLAAILVAAIDVWWIVKSRSLPR